MIACKVSSMKRGLIWSRLGTIRFVGGFSLLLALFLACGERVDGQIYTLTPAPSPVDNPLKGLVPYARPTPDRFPHSMEFNYLALSQLMKGEDQFDWEPLEQLLNDIASRGNQAVVRIFLEYPGKKEGIPQFLIDQGLTVHRYLNTNTAPFPPTEVATPNYEDPKLRELFVASSPPGVPSTMVTHGSAISQPDCSALGANGTPIRETIFGPARKFKPKSW